MNREGLWETLVYYRREVFLPDFKRMFAEELASLRNDLRAGFARMHEQFDRIHGHTAEIQEILDRIAPP